ncbi:hypothetical protein CC86DRAFT_456695 [Ophiobolus disseminans]|uniref:Uncharacterized protein n=1 Tax=Ophiobolus disseminans TaxID=1469910 RepID=A0A6A6ZW97_9PLEO|nr:hypothetical protein CC86DRAFT_456695 [Ophiobolus disseminans]
MPSLPILPILLSILFTLLSTTVALPNPTPPGTHTFPSPALTLYLHNTPDCNRLDPHPPRILQLDSDMCYDLQEARGMQVVHAAEIGQERVHVFGEAGCGGIWTELGMTDRDGRKTYRKRQRLEAILRSQTRHTTSTPAS